MKISKSFSLLALGLSMLLGVNVYSQDTLTIGTGTSSSSTRGPFQRSDTNSSSVYSRCIMLFTAAELSSAGITSGQSITELQWEKGNSNTIIGTGNANLKVYLKNSSSTATVSDSWTNYTTGSTLVLNRDFNTTNNFPSSSGWMPFVLDNAFTYTGGAIEIAIDWDASAVSTPQLSGNGAITWRWQGTSFNSIANRTGSSSAPSTISTLKAERANTRIIYTTPGPVCDAPTNLNAVSSSPTGASLSWSASASASSYNWKVVAAGAGSAAMAVSSGNTTNLIATASGLSALTSYDLYVESDCGANGTSGYAGPYTFLTESATPNDTITIGTGTSSSSTRGPVQISGGTSTTQYSRFVQIFTASELSTLGLSSGDIVSQVLWELASQNTITSGTGTFKVYVKNSTNTVAVSDSWSNHISGSTLVVDRVFDANNNFPGIEDWMPFRFNAPFTYTGGSIEVAVDWGFSIPTGTGFTNTDGNGIKWRWSSIASNLVVKKTSSSGPSSNISDLKSERANIQFVYNTPVPPGPSGLYEDFSAGSLPTDWSMTSVSSGDTWFFGGGLDFGSTATIADASGNSGEYARIDFSNDNDTTSLITPAVYVGGFTNPRLTFEYITQTTSSAFNPYNRLIVDYWNGASWTNITVIDTLTPAGWTFYEFNAIPYLYGPSSDSVRFRFSAQEGGAAVGGTGTTTYDQDLAIDEVSIEQTPTCFEATSLSAMAAGSGVDFSWVDPNGATSWEIEYGTAGFTLGTGTRSVVSTNPVNITGFMTGNSYDWYLRAICAVGDSSLWTQGNTFLYAGAPLSGVYTIDSSMATGGTNFQSFEDLEFVLNNAGVAGAVTVNVAPNTYNDNIILNAIPGASATNTITIDGGDATTTTIAHDKSVSNFTVGLLGSSYVTFKNLSIITASGTTATDKWGVSIRTNSEYITIDSCIILLPIATTTDVAGIQISAQGANDDVNGQNAHHVTLSNNIIRGGERGITVRGSTVASARNSNLTIINNSITQADDFGIRVDGYDSVLIANNYIDSLNYAFSDAIYFTESENFEVTNNYGKAPDNGFYASDLNFDNAVTGKSIIANNMFIGGDDGMYLDDCEEIDIFHNSTSAADYAIYINDQVNFDIRNNIFYSSGGDIPFYYADAATATFATFDYNIYYTTGANIARSSSGNYADLAALQTGLGGNVNSLQGDPVFVNPTSDLHASGSLANDAGDNTVGITTDYDGDTRPLAPSTTVDIGADEFTPANCVIPGSLISSNVTATSALATWTENGTATQWEIEYGPSGYTPGMGIATMIVTDTFATISSLTAQTSYDWYVRAICGANDTSGYAGSSNFTTLCAAIAAPYMENFDGLALTSPYIALPTCWTPQTGPDFWDVTNGSTNSGFYLNFPNDHTTGSGNYMWIDASGDILGNAMETPLIDMSGLTTPYAGFWFASNNTNNAVNHTIALEVWDGASWVSVASASGNNTSWVEVAGVVPSGVPSTAQFRITAIAATGTTSSTYYFNDLGIDDFFVIEQPSCVAPISLTTSNLASDSVTLGWTEVGTATNWVIEYGAAGFTPGTGTTVATSSNPFNLTGLTPTTDYDWYVRSVCAAGDSSAWVGLNSFTTLCVPFVAPYTENFDGLALTSPYTALPTCWTPQAGPDFWDVTNGSTNSGFYLNFPNDHTTGSGNYMWIDASQDILGNAMETPLIDMSGLTTPYAGFWFASNNTNNAVNHTVALDVWDGSAWLRIDSAKGNNTSWVEVAGVVPSGVPSTAQFRIMAIADTGTTASTYYFNDLGVDDFFVIEQPSCVAPISLTTSNLASDSVTLGWTEVGTATNWVIEWGPAGFTAGTGTAIAITSNPFNLNGLTPATGYDWYVRSVCAAGDSSAWVGPNSFTTNCLAVTTYPFVENFENGLTCWSQEYSSSTADWTTQNGNQNGSVSALNGTGNAFFYSGSYAGDATYLVSPTFDLTGVSNPELSFFYTQVDWSTDQDTLGVYYRTSSSGAWTYLASYNSSVATWTQETISLPNPSADYSIAFLGYSGWGYGVTLDSVVVEDVPMAVCYTPVSLVSSAITATSADINWSDTNTVPAANYEYSYGSAGFTAGTGSQVVTAAGPVTISGLTGATAYDWYVRAICAPGDTSAWSDTASFTTAMIPDPYYPIGTINTEDPVTGVADSLNVVCWTSGTVVGIDLDGNTGLSFYISDLSSGSQEGINVFNFNDISGYVVNEGDSIMIHGPVIQYNGLTEINVDSISIISTNATLPTAMAVTSLDESTEAKYITASDFWFLDSTSVGASFSTNLDLTNGTDTITMRIDSDTDILDSIAASTAGKINIGDTLCGPFYGVGGQFDNSSPYTSGYQIFPMRWSDLTICRLAVGIEDEQGVRAQFSLVPNPSNGVFELRTSGFNAASVRVIIRDLSGRIVSNEFINNANSSFNKSFDLSGEANGVYFISITDGNDVINKKLIKQ